MNIKMSSAQTHEITEWLIEYNTETMSFNLTIWVRKGKGSEAVHIREFDKLEAQRQDIVLDMLRYHKPVYWVQTKADHPELGVIRVQTAEIGKFIALK